MGYALKETTYSYRAWTKNGVWTTGDLTTDKTITIHEGSNVFHYGQALFEGLKAYKQKDGKVVLFRPEMNYERLQSGLQRIVGPTMPRELFFEAIEQIVKSNVDDIPEYGTQQSLYIRPFVIGHGMNLGVKPSDEYLFSVFCAPVGTYFKGGLEALEFVTTQYDRAATNGMGQVKFAGNYGSSLYPRQLAKDAGYAGVIYLDPATHTKIDEVGAANFFGVTHDNVLVTPKSSSILPSITRKSILYLAEHVLGMKVEERECFIDNIQEFKEAGACGTAAIITPIKAITHKDKRHQFGDGKVGPTIKKLYDLLLGIYYGDIEAPEGWIYEVQL
ncbi:branched-chain amino acid aminotransferase [Candidatus Xianfuyuplasma coldseepsis]|uniref:Branched-chain-amino-acid aminotransferase n=1 Tax=Candidatus Xianfuyuplasma coldseepsis TaxID=2782163 RepID=A0A7L7KQW4_9MOLU|nr:branched-chain amino acid aminotransferase [Xianfuyuplasma coldseepsis]QMS84198.1 branched-chain amino acid aminotransferase [Xianfuyuplasma coldseepsis]